VLAGAYWLYVAPHRGKRERLMLAAAAASAPVLWALTDLAATGEPLHTFTRTRETVGEAFFTTGIANVPDAVSRGLRLFLRAPLLIGGLIGAGLALYLRRRRVGIPVALLGFGLVWFAALGAGRLALLERYLLLPAAMLAVLFGLAAVGWRRAEPSRLRRVWRVGGVALVVAALAYVPAQRDLLGELRDELELRGRVQDDLRELATSPALHALIARCSGVHVPASSLVPVVAYHLERPPGQILPLAREWPTRGVFIAPATREAAIRYELDSPLLASRQAQALRGFRKAIPGRSWTAYEKGCRRPTA
jgi:hypothetical protein